MWMNIFKGVVGTIKFLMVMGAIEYIAPGFGKEVSTIIGDTIGSVIENEMDKGE